MKIAVTFLRREVYILQCLAEDARTAISPQLHVRDLATVRKLLRYAGANDAEMADFENSIRQWGQGSVWIRNLTIAGARILRLDRRRY